MASKKAKQRPPDLNHDDSRSSSTETVLHHPQHDRKGNSASELGSVLTTPGLLRSALRQTGIKETALGETTNQPNLPRRVHGVGSGINQVLGLPPIDAPKRHFDANTTQEAGWQLPEDIAKTIEYQAKRHTPPKPKRTSSEQQARVQCRTVDPEERSTYSSCTQCDPEGGPTDCKHPGDPKGYSTELNPVPEDDPAFHWCDDCPHLPETPKKPIKPFLLSKLISTKSPPSEAAVTRRAKEREGYRPLDQVFRSLSGFVETIRGKSKGAQQPDEMLSARHLSDFLTQNVEAGVVTSFIMFTTHGTLLGYSSPLPVATARSIAAITGLTWRANDSALLRGVDIGPITGGASLLKTLEITQAEKGPGLFNMICEHKKYLMSVQWIKPGFLVAAMTELDESTTIKGKGNFAFGAGSEQDNDEAWEDEGAVEETSEGEGDRAKMPTKQSKLFHKSQGLASALREQWKIDDFKLPPGFR
ncbi:MAG: hypothetical protein Q9166_000113 [cf. Caloplaca sp. 2 TL-2023]